MTLGTMSYAADFPSKLEQVHSMIKAVADRDTKFLSMFLNMDAMVQQTKFEWVDKTLVGFKDTLSAALASSTTTVITVAGGTNAPKRYIDTISLIMIEDEVLLVASTITVSTNYTSMCVTRAQQGTTASTHPNGIDVVIIGNPRNEGFEAGRDDSQKGNRMYNFTQIFHREAKLTGTSQHVRSAGDEMKMNKQIADLTKEIVKELQYTLIYGQRGVTDMVEYSDRRVGGFNFWAKNGGTNSDNKGNAIDKNTIEDVIERYLGNGGDANQLCFAVSTRQQRKLNELKDAKIVGGGMTQKETNLNSFINRYDFGTNAQVDIITLPDLRTNELLYFQKDLIEVHPMEGRAWTTQPLPINGDYVREMILGEYTFIFRNVRETLGRVYNLAT